VILSSVKTPLEYGVVLRDTLDRIFAFSEKPDWSETLSDLANTGVYILSPKVLAKIPEGKPFDFAQDLFPLLLREGYALYGYKDRGYWCDIGKIPTLYRCNMDVLQGKAKTYLEPAGKTFRSEDGEGCYFVSNSAVVERGADIQRNTVISADAVLAEGSRAEGAIIMEKVELKKGATVKDAILSEGCRIGEGAFIPPNTVLGAGSVAGKGSTAVPGKKYPAGSVLSQKAPFCEEGMVFTEQGAARGDCPGLDREDAQKLGFSLACMKEERVGVLWDEEAQESACFATALAGGITLGGADALMLDRGTEEMASFAASMLSVPVVFVSAIESRGAFFIFGKEDFFIAHTSRVFSSPVYPPLASITVIPISREWVALSITSAGFLVIISKSLAEFVPYRIASNTLVLAKRETAAYNARLTLPNTRADNATTQESTVRKRAPVRI
jgi:mannose-1-phosphate guanylyltransferase/phosphomannomutase